MTRASNASIPMPLNTSLHNIEVLPASKYDPVTNRTNNRDGPQKKSAAPADTGHGTASFEATNLKGIHSTDLLPNSIYFDPVNLQNALFEKNPVLLVRDPETAEHFNRLKIPAVALRSGDWTPSLAEHVEGFSFCLVDDDLQWIDRTARALDGYIPTPSYIMPKSAGKYYADKLYDESFTAPYYEFRDIEVNPQKLTAEPFKWRPTADIPRVDWLYGHHLIRGYVSCTIAPGGSGKSFLLMSEALAMVTGKDLLDERAGSKKRVWIWSEDPYEQMEIRLHAALKIHNLNYEGIEGRLFVNSFRQNKLSIAQVRKGAISIGEPIVERLIEEINENQIDCLIIDPFVKTHEVNENDNIAVNAVVDAYQRIATETGCAIELVHHSRKIGGSDVTAESSRGGVALIAAVRDARVINKMSKREADDAGVVDYWRYFRVHSDKSNLAPTDRQTKWFKLNSLEMDNGDNVAAITRWKWPNAFDELTEDAKQAFIQELSKKPMKASNQAKEWAGFALLKHMKLDTDVKGNRSKATMILKTWKKEGQIVEHKGIEGGKERPFFHVNTGVTP